MQLQDVQDKVAKTKFEHYGSCTYNNRLAAAQTCIKKYGVPHQTQAKEVVDKTEKYKNNIVETVENKSHFGNNTEKIILIDLSLGMTEN